MARRLQGPLYVESRSESKNAPLITLFCSPHPPTSWRHSGKTKTQGEEANDSWGWALLRWRRPRV